jgi:hypothetical protein
MGRKINPAWLLLIPLAIAIAANWLDTRAADAHCLRQPWLDMSNGC